LWRFQLFDVKFFLSYIAAVDSRTETELKMVDFFLLGAIFVYMFPVVACLGVLGNGVAFWVWMGERCKSTTTLLFLYLAISDNMFLIFWLALYVWFLEGFMLKCFEFLGRLGLSLSVHTTTLITINRWFAIWKPLHVHITMSRRRVIFLSVLTSLWCVLGIGTDVIFGFRGHEPVILFLYHVLPILVLVAFSTSMLWMIFKHRR
jgi:hypothetical protein